MWIIEGMTRARMLQAATSVALTHFMWGLGGDSHKQHCRWNSRITFKLHVGQPTRIREFNYILMPKYSQQNNALLLVPERQVFSQETKRNLTLGFPRDLVR